MVIAVPFSAGFFLACFRFVMPERFVRYAQFFI